MRDNAKININGEVVIYLDNEDQLKLRGNAMLNSDDNAANLRIYAYHDHDHQHGQVEIKDNASLSAVVYAPNAKVKIKDNAQIYGAIAGGTIKIEDSPDVHYDEHIRTKLSDVPTDEVEMIVQNWHEM
jgi:cytoskeletal protein CcmA (bactofilin family)